MIPLLAPKQSMLEFILVRDTFPEPSEDPE